MSEVLSERKNILLEAFNATRYDQRLQWAFPPQSCSINQGQLIVHTAGETGAVQCVAKLYPSDYWQRTHYGFQNHNGHFLHMPNVRGDFIMSTRVTTQPQQRFDQAGLMVLLSPSCWLKTSVEHNPGNPNQLGVVVTNMGYSDWSTMDFPSSITTLCLRVRREGSDYIVEACIPDETLPEGACATSLPIRVGSGNSDSPATEWTQLRICHLVEDVSPAGVSKDGPENVAFGQQLENMADLLPLSGVSAGLYACSPKPGGGFQAEFSHLHIVAGRNAGHM